MELDGHFFTRLAAAGQFALFYFYKGIIPFEQNIFYERWNIHVENILGWLPTISVLLVLVAAVLWRGVRQSPLFWSLAYILATLIPVVGFFNISFMRYAWVSDQYFYLGLPGLIVGTMALCPGRIRYSAVGKGIRFGLCLVCMLLSHRQAVAFGDEETLWRDSLEKNPGAWGALVNLAQVREAKGDSEGAVHYYREALRIEPNRPELRYDLAGEYESHGQTDLAIGEYEKALALRPNYADAHANLGRLLANLGRLDDAIFHDREALRFDPDHVFARNNLGLALVAKGRPDLAIGQYEKVLQFVPNYSTSENNLAVALVTLGKTDLAIEHLRRVVEVDPEYADAHFNLGYLLQSRGQMDEASQHFQKAISLNPAIAAKLDSLKLLKSN